jgi:Tfp pilus assembly PilM family ATPase
MTRRRRTLPLGIDYGESRVRVALLEGDDRDTNTLIGVAARMTGDDAIQALREAVDELGTRERRCVFGLGLPDAILLRATFPAMSAGERARAARYEAARRWGGDMDQSIVTVNALGGGDGWVLGVARRAALARCLTAASRVRLRTLAIDDAGLALQRVFAEAAGTIDIGAGSTRLTVFAHPLPIVRCIPIGGDAFTEAIAQALGIDAASAEERKRSSGFAGVAEARRDALIAAVAEVLADVHPATGGDGRGFVLIGNGSRIPGLADAFERAGIPVEPAALDSTSATLPPDVLRAAGADWALAFGLALWETAA